MLDPFGISEVISGAQLLFYLLIIVIFFVLLTILLCCLCRCIRSYCCSPRRRAERDDEVDLLERPHIQDNNSLLNGPHSIFSRLISRKMTRATALQAIRERRESMLEAGISSDSVMDRLYEQAVDMILDPSSRASNERSDVDLDLRQLRSRDAEQLIRRLLSRSRSHAVPHGIGTVYTFVNDNNSSQQQPRRVLRVDAGHDIQSENDVLFLQHTVRNLLDARGVRYTTLPVPLEGTFLIDYRSAPLEEADSSLIEA